MLLWSLPSVSSKVLHKEFSLKRLNIIFFNLSHDNSSLNSEITKLSKRHILQLMLNRHRSQPGKLPVQKHTHRISQIVPTSLTWSQFVWCAVITHPIKLFGLIWWISLKGKISPGKRQQNFIFKLTNLDNPQIPPSNVGIRLTIWNSYRVKIQI